ncbi:MAG: peptidase M22, partial [Ruminococcus sp.]|nr:peptidase M22 [Ruminococcus sp.]
MGVYLGIDTSNYTTSCSLFSIDKNIKNMIQEKKLLPVKSGEAGLRQSEAVFHHTKQLSMVFEKLFSKVTYGKLNGIGVTIKPRNQEGSYMPCFICGENTADIIGTVMNIPV